jgi:membrane associated rhomboid family serine protease
MVEDQPVCCYRHPDRETGIRCTRCERPICPECMISASVGFQCPDCVRQGATPRTRQRTIAGGLVARDPLLVTKILIALNVAVYALELAVGSRIADDLGLRAACYPGTGQWCSSVADGEWYRIITSAFVHDLPPNFTHILFNMLTLWWIGGPLERTLGRSRYVALYLVSALAGSAAVLLLAPHSLTFGASGALYGLFGATAVFVKRLNYDMRPILILLGLNILFTFTWPHVSWQAHLGGLVGGTAVAVGMFYAPRERRNAVQWGTTAGVLVLSLVLSVIAVAQVTS